MLYNMTYEVTVGAYRVQTLVSVTVRRSVENLADTAEIVLPGTLYNAAIEVESKIKVGDAVTIKLGYAETSKNGIQTEFEGYLKAIRTDTADIILECEDALWQLRRKELKDEQVKQKTLKWVLQHILQGTGYSVDCDYSFTYETFTFSHATAYDVLRKIQEDTKADIYLQDGVLHLHPAYGKTGNTLKYDFAVNICGSDLKYVRKEDKNLKVTITCTAKDGSKLKGESGTDGGQKIERVVSCTNQAELNRIAENEYNIYCYDGYEGSITGWLIPYCKPTDLVSLHDGAYEYKDGTYYVLATETTFSSAGGRRKITIGRRMS